MGKLDTALNAQLKEARQAIPLKGMSHHHCHEELGSPQRRLGAQRKAKPAGDRANASRSRSREEKAGVKRGRRLQASMLEQAAAGPRATRCRSVRTERARRLQLHEDSERPQQESESASLRGRTTDGPKLASARALGPREPPPPVGQVRNQRGNRLEADAALGSRRPTVRTAGSQLRPWLLQGKGPRAESSLFPRGPASWEHPWPRETRDTHRGAPDPGGRAPSPRTASWPQGLAKICPVCSVRASHGSALLSRSGLVHVGHVTTRRLGHS